MNISLKSEQMAVLPKEEIFGSPLVELSYGRLALKIFRLYDVQIV